jgi:hypothetical protein
LADDDAGVYEQQGLRKSTNQATMAPDPSMQQEALGKHCRQTSLSASKQAFKHQAKQAQQHNLIFMSINQHAICSPLVAAVL